LTDTGVGSTSDVTPNAAADHVSMARNRSGQSRRPTDEDRRFFDGLLFMRGLYAERGPQDVTPVATIANVIASVNGSFKASPQPLP
jgi:hypothetical protein